MISIARGWSALRQKGMLFKNSISAEGSTKKEKKLSRGKKKLGSAGFPETWNHQNFGLNPTVAVKCTTAPFSTLK